MLIARARRRIKRLIDWIGREMVADTTTPQA
jgi:hypothetical protein